MVLNSEYLKSTFCFRYTFFIVLYPMGVTGELLTIYAALPYVQKTGLYSVTLPNKYNFSFDYYTFLIVVMISYIPRKSFSFVDLIYSLLNHKWIFLLTAEVFGGDCL